MVATNKAPLRAQCRFGSNADMCDAGAMSALSTKADNGHARVLSLSMRLLHYVGADPVVYGALSR